MIYAWIYLFKRGLKLTDLLVRNPGSFADYSLNSQENEMQVNVILLWWLISCVNFGGKNQQSFDMKKAVESELG